MWGLLNIRSLNHNDGPLAEIGGAELQPELESENSRQEQLEQIVVCTYQFLY
jgi:hypothetical protein